MVLQGLGLELPNLTFCGLSVMKSIICDDSVVFKPTVLNFFAKLWGTNALKEKLKWKNSILT